MLGRKAMIGGTAIGADVEVLDLANAEVTNIGSRERERVGATPPSSHSRSERHQRRAVASREAPTSYDVA
jgi:hypothetical protein